MPWQYVGVSTAVEVTATSHTLTFPTGIQEGDLLIAVISSRIASTVSITLPSGWTLVAESKTNNVVAAGTTSEASGMMAYCVRGASNPSSTFTHPTAPSVAVGRIVAYRGQSATPFDVGIGAKTSTNITAVSTTGLTAAEGNELIVKGFCSGRAATSTTHNATNPATSSGSNSVQTADPIVGTWQERQDASTATGADTGLAIADAVKSAAGATGNLTCTASLAGGHAQVAGAFKIQKFGYANSTSATSLTITIPATASGDSVIVAGSLHAITAPTITCGGQSITYGTLGGLITPRIGPRSNKNLFVGIITGMTVGTTSVSVTGLTAGNNEVGAWVVPGLSSPVQDKGIWAPYGIVDTPSQTGETDALTNSSSFVCAYNRPMGSTTAIDRTYPNSGGIVADQLATTTLGSCFAHQHKANTGQVQGAFTNSAAGGADCMLAVYRSTPPSVTTPAIGLYDFQQRELWDFSMELWPYFNKTTRAGDVIIVAGSIENTDTSGFSCKTNNNDAITLGTLGGSATPLVVNGASYFVGVIKTPTVGSYAVTLTTNNSDRKAMACWIVSGLTNPTQDKGVYAASDVGPVLESGSTGTLSVADEFAIGHSSKPHVTAINVDATGSEKFLLDSFVTNLDSAWSHQITTVTTAIQAAFEGGSGADMTFCATFMSAPSAVTGTLTTTEAPDVASFPSAKVEWIAQLAANETRDTLLFNGSVFWAAPLAASEASDTAVINATVFWAAPLAASEARDVAAFNVTSQHLAALTVTEAPDVASLLGSVAWVAQLAASEAPDTAAFNGTVQWIPVTGTLAVTEAPDVAALTGNVRWAAVLAASEAPDVIAFTGGIYGTGTLTVTEAPDVAALSGSVAWVAILAASEAKDVAAFSGGIYGTGTLAVSEASDTAAMAGSVFWAAPLAAAEPADTAAFVGTVRWAAILAASEAPDIAAFNVTATHLGTLAVSEARDVAALVGGIYGTGTLAASEAPDTFTGNGTVLSSEGGILVATEARDSVALAGTVTGVAGTLGASEAADVVALAGRTEWAAPLAVTEARDTAAAIVVVQWVAPLAATEAPDAAAFLGSVRWAVTLAASEAPDTVAFTGGIYATGVLAAGEARDTVAWTGTVFDVGGGFLAATEAPDTAAFSATSQMLAVLAASEAPDTAAFLVDTTASGVLAASEAPDIAAFSGLAVTLGVLDATEKPDTARFSAAPIQIQIAEGRFLARDIRRVRSLQSDEPRLRCLKYPVPRPRDLLNNYGERERELSGQRSRTFERA